MSRMNAHILMYALQGGKHLYYGPAIRFRRESPGTAVCVRDAFYNVSFIPSSSFTFNSSQLPIRRTSHPSTSRTLELVKKEIEVFALAVPHVSFTLDNAAKVKEGTGKGRVMTLLPVRRLSLVLR